MLTSRHTASTLTCNPPPARVTSHAPTRRKRALEGISLWLAVLLLLFVHPLYADASEGAGGLRLVAQEAGAGQPALLLETDYRVTVSGLIADTRLRQSFRNDSRHWREGVFVFPLPENASVYGLTMKAGDRVITGEIRERDEARRRYQQARQEGHQAARVDQQRPNLFTSRLANIPPGETVHVELQYQQAVTYQSGVFELRLPTTLTPRYMPGQPAAASAAPWQEGWARATDEVPDAGQISPFTVPAGAVGQDSHQARVELELRPGLPVEQISSPGHQLNSVWNGETVVVTPVGGQIAMDRDLVVRWTPVRGHTPTAAVFHERWQGQDYLLTLLVPGRLQRQGAPRELVFVIDTSGSMAGASIRQARQALLRGLDTLAPGDRFNVIEFNSQPHSLFMGAVPATANNLGRARRYVRGLRADGGTEMDAALAAALRDEVDGESRHLRQVVFITDGAVGNEAALFDRIRRQLGNSRLFTVAIGSAPNRHFMREAARFGRGSSTAISNLTDLAGPLQSLFARMQSAVLTDIRSDWSRSTPVAEHFPQRPGDLFQGEPLVQVSRGQAPEGTLTVSGRLPDGSPWQRRLALDQAAPGVGLHRYWAQQKINGLLDAELTGEPAPETRSRVTALALEHQLMTRFTSFVAIDRRQVRASSQPLRSESVPVLLPAGSDTTMLRYPRTATPSALLLVLGGAGLVLVSAMWLLRSRRLV